MSTLIVFLLISISPILIALTLSVFFIAHPIIIGGSRGATTASLIARWIDIIHREIIDFVISIPETRLIVLSLLLLHWIQSNYTIRVWLLAPIKSPITHLRRGTAHTIIPWIRKITTVQGGFLQRIGIESHSRLLMLLLILQRICVIRRVAVLVVVFIFLRDTWHLIWNWVRILYEVRLVLSILFVSLVVNFFIRLAAPVVLSLRIIGPVYILKWWIRLLLVFGFLAQGSATPLICPIPSNGIWKSIGFRILPWHISLRRGQKMLTNIAVTFAHRPSIIKIIITILIIMVCSWVPILISLDFIARVPIVSLIIARMMQIFIFLMEVIVFIISVDRSTLVRALVFPIVFLKWSASASLSSQRLIRRRLLIILFILLQCPVVLILILDIGSIIYSLGVHELYSLTFIFLRFQLWVWLVIHKTLSWRLLEVIMVSFICANILIPIIRSTSLHWRCLLVPLVVFHVLWRRVLRLILIVDAAMKVSIYDFRLHNRSCHWSCQKATLF